MKPTSRIFTLTTARRLPYASLLLGAAAVVVHMLPSLSAHLEYDRLAIAAGELWRILSGHWTHVSGGHLTWDVLTFVVLGTLCEQASRARFYACLAGSALLIPVVLWITLPHLATYRGLSGIDSALFALLAVTLLKDQIHARRWSSVAALSTVSLAFIAKVGYELATGETIFVDSRAADMLAVPLAHCVGAAVGIALGLTQYRKLDAPGVSRPQPQAQVQERRALTKIYNTSPHPDMRRAYLILRSRLHGIGSYKTRTRRAFP